MTSISEAQWQQRVMDTAALLGYRTAHFRPAQARSGRWATPMQGDRGFPDLVLAKSGRILVVELKSDTGKLGPGQREWLDELGEHGRLWRPRDWSEVLAELKEQWAA
jgi:hypothetical protein